MNWLGPPLRGRKRRAMSTRATLLGWTAIHQKLHARTKSNVGASTLGRQVVGMIDNAKDSQTLDVEIHLAKLTEPKSKMSRYPAV